jgi:hypothetical protein
MHFLLSAFCFPVGLLPGRRPGRGSTPTPTWIIRNSFNWLVHLRVIL